MQTSRRDFLRITGGAIAATSLGLTLQQQVQAQDVTSLPASSDPALHLLNRATFGPLPDDVAAIRRMGIEAWLDQQLNPDSIDDSAMDALLQHNPILAMDRQTVHTLGFDGRVEQAVIEGMMSRAQHSQRQLCERMVEFWTDHFNLPAAENVHDLVVMHRDVIRRHALGSFRDLVIGTAQSPAMLYYLDQAYSDRDNPNENYARELMELHTLGVDGGYTERDVKEAARALTGWRVQDSTPTGFYFDREAHDFDAKTVLGHDMPAGRGIEDGLHLMSIVVNHPATAAFLCHKLCVRFVSDEPPASLVDSATRVWLDTSGQIVPVLRHILLSAEFNASVGRKFRRPLDFLIGALRVTGTTFADNYVLDNMLDDLGQPPYGWLPPDGYPDTTQAWLNSSGLLARWNVAMTLTHDAYSVPYSNMNNRLDRFIDDPATVDTLVRQVAERVFGVVPADDSLTAFIDYASDGAGATTPVTPLLLASKLATLFGMMLASPLYQWR